MFIIKEGTLMMAVSKGDSASFTVTFTERVPEDGTNILFTVKNKADHSIMIQKRIPVQNGAVNVDLYSTDTNKLDKDIDYVWDVRVLYSEMEVETPMVPSTFLILEVAGDV